MTNDRGIPALGVTTLLVVESSRSAPSVGGSSGRSCFFVERVRSTRALIAVRVSPIRPDFSVTNGVVVVVVVAAAMVVDEDVASLVVDAGTLRRFASMDMLARRIIAAFCRLSTW